MVVDTEGYVTKGHKETFMGKVYVLFPDCMASWVHTDIKSYQIVHTNLCNLLCVDYTLMKL